MPRPNDRLCSRANCSFLDVFRIPKNTTDHCLLEIECTYEDFTTELSAEDISICNTYGQRMKEKVVKHSMKGTNTGFLFCFEIGYLSHEKGQIRVDSNLGNASLAIIRIFNRNIVSWNL